jgi:hypothetical protein
MSSGAYALFIDQQAGGGPAGFTFCMWTTKQHLWKCTRLRVFAPR